MFIISRLSALAYNLLNTKCLYVLWAQNNVKISSVSWAHLPQCCWTQFPDHIFSHFLEHGKIPNIMCYTTLSVSGSWPLSGLMEAAWKKTAGWISNSQFSVIQHLIYTPQRPRKSCDYLETAVKFAENAVYAKRPQVAKLSAKEVWPTHFLRFFNCRNFHILKCYHYFTHIASITQMRYIYFIPLHRSTASASHLQMNFRTNMTAEKVRGQGSLWIVSGRRRWEKSRGLLKCQMDSWSAITNQSSCGKSVLTL